MLFLLVRFACLLFCLFVCFFSLRLFVCLSVLSALLLCGVCWFVFLSLGRVPWGLASPCWLLSSFCSFLLGGDSLGCIVFVCFVCLFLFCSVFVCFCLFVCLFDSEVRNSAQFVCLFVFLFVCLHVMFI